MGYQLGIYTTLEASPKALTAEDLAKPTGADTQLVTRVARYLAASRIITERGENQYVANDTTKAMTDPRMKGGMSYFYNVSDPVVHKLPEFLEENNFKNPVGQPSVWNKTRNTEMNIFSWLKSAQPELLQDLQGLRSFPKEGNWLNCVPFPPVSGTDRIAFVGIGGNAGPECSRLRDAHPELSGHIVLQSPPETSQDAPMIKGVRSMSCDIFTPQPVKGLTLHTIQNRMHHTNILG